MKLIALLLSAIFLLTGCSKIPLNNSTKSLADYNFEELTFTGAYREFSDSGDTIYYKGEITGDTARQLYEIVIAQMSQPTITGGNYTGFDCLTIKTKDGGEFRCYYTFDNTEYSTTPSADEIDHGMPVENFLGTCFIVVGNSSQKYKIIDNETENHFNTLISEYLKAKYKPASKLADNGRIILIRRRTNYAWGEWIMACLWTIMETGTVMISAKNNMMIILRRFTSFTRSPNRFIKRLLTRIKLTI